jgi:formyltetrahydrofolate-dependent phosphoribosylglycinamide formyltransferase
MPLPQIAVFASGRGSNLQALIAACADGRLAARIAVVVCNRPHASAVLWAQQAGIPLLLCPRNGEDRLPWELGLVQALEPFQPQLLVLAGWDQMLLGPLLQRYPQSIINLHPALPGVHPGLGAIARAHKAFSQGGPATTGAMVHRVTAEMDGGPAVLVDEIAMIPGESLEALEQRVHVVEHALLIRAVAKALQGG